ncbi:APSES transcription factor [Drepanopeziza brunnea f. sp. 'multigermtubi' MB_m1]|uniref:APSES transcription factor n=2 Tax=Drepanopeziza brunnea f. sp. 'multigermtubi' TaxID=698441 RepID=K1WND8_MARBU|nr:APSES transcription factor [Drepanopeziza brunnea f. sp. 'multigermtubi' MB_m1]EKD13867.1 APSES transcription factor [Drepanopeziza brunnea f. sp. 'multigermtubi' MB_m1]
MNHGPQEMYYPISNGQPPAPQTVTSSGGMGHYPQQHQHQHQHQQPPLLQPGPAQYSPAPHPYPQYGYQNGLTSPQSAGHQVSGAMGPQGNVLPLPAIGQPMPGPGYGAAQPGFDTTGQVAPPGMKPRVTATLWEDEGSLCFQVEAKGVCVARREDNQMINGTKLLNVAGMTRGRRDGILKSEKMRHVVKIGPMHLKGVWIPYDRALDFANKEKITELLYPLFVHNIGALLYHPTNQTRTNAVMAAAEKRKLEQNQMRNLQAPGLPSLHQHHHHSMNSSIGGSLPGSQHSIAPHPNVGRPGMDRAHTFPTPPTSASSVMGNMGSSDGNFQWGPPGPMGGVQGTNSLSIDTGLSNTRSMPTTPATTPPGNSIQGMQQYQQSSQQPYDSSRQMYSAPPPQQNAYPQSAPGQQDMSRYPQPNAYIKNEMGPPTGRAPESENGHHDPKDSNGMIHHGQGQNQVGHSQGEDEADHEHEAEYTHGNPASYDSSRGPYSYSHGSAVGGLPGEHTHLSPEMTGSPNHPASGRATPRTASAPQPYFTSQQQGYNTPPRVQPPSSNLYNVISSERGTANGSTGGDVYAPQPDMGNSMSNGYAAQQPVMNGAPASNKRGRDDEDDGRPSSRGPGGEMDLKRRKTIREGSVSGPPSYDPAPLNRARTTVTQRRR